MTNKYRYITQFKTHSNYQNYIEGNNKVLPNISYCEDNDDVHYNHWTWAEEYLTTVALEDGTISFNIWKSMSTNMITSISYSTDNGETWTTTVNQNNKSEHLVINVNVNTGDKILWKGIATQTGYFDNEEGDFIGSFFSSDCEFDAKGNVMSLLYGDNYKGQTTINKNYAFCCLFYDYNEEKTCVIVNAKDLSLPAITLTQYCYCQMFYNCTFLVTTPELPATTLTSYCYQRMFQGCTSLTTAPVLPATTLSEYCYYSMFQDCTSLTTAPELPATILAQYCYYGMFYGCTLLVNAPELPATTLAVYCYSIMFRDCTSLVTAPTLPATTLANYCYNLMFYDCTSLTNVPNELPATTLTNYCYSGMFNGCTSLTTTPVLPATILANKCYSSMFRSCTSLTTAPELPATTLVSNCYENMFVSCTSLTIAPELPATTLINNCYASMFQDCTSLVNAPILPATTLVKNCYRYMFYGCRSLNYIKAMFTTTPSTTYTDNWVINVSATGTFVKNSAATWNVTGWYGVPSGWTVQTATS